MTTTIVELFEEAAREAEAIDMAFDQRFTEAKSIADEREAQRAHATLRAERAQQQQALARRLQARQAEAQRLLSLVGEDEEGEVGPRLAALADRFDDVNGFGGIGGLTSLLGLD